MTMKRIMIALGALAILVGAGAWAHGRAGRNMQQMITKRVAAMEDLIKATPQQRAQIEQSRDTILNALQARRQQKGQQQTHEKLMQLLTADKVNPNDLYAVANRHAQAIQDMAKVIVPEIVKVHDVLTPAQRQTLAQKAQEMRQRHQEHQGGFGGPGE
jgi:Spy/CpxP family protein refolding chaperone